MWQWSGRGSGVTEGMAPAVASPLACLGEPMKGLTAVRAPTVSQGVKERRASCTAAPPGNRVGFGAAAGTAAALCPCRSVRTIFHGCLQRDSSSVL